MAAIEGEIVIDRGIEDVFDFVANECNEPLFNVEMLSAEKVSEGPVGVGTRFRAVMRSGRRQFPVEIECTTYERPSRLGSHSVAGGMDIDGELTFTSQDGATHMAWAWDVRPRGAMKIISPLINWMGRRQEERIWTALKLHLES